MQIVVNSNHYSYLKRILRIIRPENIISLIFSDMRAFRMLISEFVLQFDMERFNRLHFVSLHQVNDMQLEYVLKQMTTHQGRIQKIFYGGAVQRANFFKGGAECQKTFFWLGENEYFPFRGGAAAPTAPPLDPPLLSCSNIYASNETRVTKNTRFGNNNSTKRNSIFFFNNLIRHKKKISIANIFSRTLMWKVSYCLRSQSFPFNMKSDPYFKFDNSVLRRY